MHKDDREDFFSCWCSFIGLLLPSVCGKTGLWERLMNFLPFPKYLFIQPFLCPAVQEFWNMQNVKKMNLELLDKPCQYAGDWREYATKGPKTRSKHIEVLLTHKDCGNSMAWNGVGLSEWSHNRGTTILNWHQVMRSCGNAPKCVLVKHPSAMADPEKGYKL